MPTDTRDDRKRRYTRGGDTHTTAMERFKVAESAYHEQAQRELDDLKFAARKNQWRDDELNARKAFTAGGGSMGSIDIAARPVLVIDKLRQPIQQLENQQRQANLAVDVHPESLNANQQTADALQGLYRHIQVTSRADQIARFWAYSRALKCGRGVYRVEKVYCDPNPKADDPARFDQEIRISRILNQAGVLLDPFAQEPDWSDGEWAFVKSWIPRKRYQRLHKDSELSSDEADFALIGADAPGWLRTTGNEEQDAVLEVEYWRVEYGEEETITGGDDDEQERTVRTRRVFCCKMNAKETYDEVEWDTDDIPLVPVVANEENIEGDRIWEGLVAPAKDSQRTYNMMTSAFVETIALAPRSPWLATVEQIGPYRAWWMQSNVRNFPFLPYKAVSEAGQPLPPPQRMFGEPPIQALAAGIHQFDANINATTGFFDPSRGNLSAGERSGVALKALQQQSETGNSGYLDNLAQISMTRESQIVLKLIPKVYDRPGRVVTLLGLDNKRSQVMLNTPFVAGPNGQPQQVPLGPTGVPQPPPNVAPEDVRMISLEEGVYGSVVTIGKAHATAAQEGTEAMGALLQAEPQLLQYIGDLYFKHQDWPGAQEIAERFKKLLPPQLQDQAGQPNAQQLQQENAQLKAQMQQLQPFADQNQAKLQQAQLDAQAKLQAAQIDAQTKQQIAAAQEETKRALAAMQVEIERMRAFANSQVAAGKAQADIQRTVISEAAETHRQTQDHLHEAAIGAADLQGETDLSHTAHRHDLESATVSHEQARQLQREAPKPKGVK